MKEILYGFVITGCLILLLFLISLSMKIDYYNQKIDTLGCDALLSEDKIIIVSAQCPTNATLSTDPMVRAWSSQQSSLVP